MSEPDIRTKSGTFKKGVSGNPGGRTKQLEWCKEFADGEGKEKLLHWARSKNPKASLQALTLIFAYGYGKPRESHDLTSDGKTLLDILREARNDA